MLWVRWTELWCLWAGSTGVRYSKLNRGLIGLNDGLEILISRLVNDPESVRASTSQAVRFHPVDRLSALILISYNGTVSTALSSDMFPRCGGRPSPLSRPPQHPRVNLADNPTPEDQHAHHEYQAGGNGHGET